MEICRIEGCEAPVKVKRESLCGRHYNRLRTHGDPLAWKKRSRPICSVEGCELKAVGGGLCDLHYRRKKRYGSTELPARPVACTAEGCDRPVQGRGLCDMHYRRMVKTGEVEPDRSCRQCGASLAGTNLQRQFCGAPCYQAWNYHERKRTHRERWLTRYGLSVASYEAMIDAQGDRCAICRTEEPGTNGNQHWCVDHDHATGDVRGLLCMSCNVGIGKFRDDPTLLAAAIEYLTRDGAPLI